MPKVTFRRVTKKRSGFGTRCNLMVKFDRNKFVLKKDDEHPFEVQPGKHKAIFYLSFLNRFIGALMGYRAAQLKYKFSLAADENLIIECGVKRNTLWYEAFTGDPIGADPSYKLKGAKGGKSVQA